MDVYLFCIVKIWYYGYALKILFFKPRICKLYGGSRNQRFVSTLKEREQAVIKMRFGLENFTKTTLEDIGKMFGVTKECIRQTEARALNKLRNSLA